MNRTQYQATMSKALGVSDEKNRMETQRFDFPISGLTCAACASQIENQLKNLPGVQDAEVHFATELATLYFDLGVLSIDQITEATPVVLRALSQLCAREIECETQTQVDCDTEPTGGEHVHVKVDFIALREAIRQVVKRPD